MRMIATMLILCVLVVAGCVQAPPAETTGAAEPAGRAERSTEPTSETPREAPVFVTYSRVGGIAGAHETLTIHEDGLLNFDVVGKEPISHRVERQRIAHVRSLIEAPEFFALEGPYIARGADLITYTITAQTSQGERTVVTTDGAEPPPHALRLRRELDALREAAVLRTAPRPIRD